MRFLVYFIVVFLIIFICVCDARKTRERKKKTSGPVVINDDYSLRSNESNVSTEMYGLGRKRKNQRKEIYSSWTTWSRCSRKCQQHRSRHCIVTSQCGANLLKEERVCKKERCAEKQVTASRGKVQDDVLEQDNFDSSSEFRVLYHLQDFPYTEWTAWTPCSRSCITYRVRKCQVPKICGNKVLQEDALCYIDGTACEKLYNKRRRRRKKKSSVVNENEMGNSKDVHPLNGLKCGIAQQSFPVRNFLRIIGGTEAQKGSWPWQVTILNRFREPFCGGTLISHGWVLTAAHCIRRKLIVRVGEWDLVENEGTEQESKVLEAFLHPDYDADTVNNDVALLQLKHQFKFNSYCQPACLPSAGEELLVNAKARILGWGKRKNSAIYGTDVLHEAEVPIVDPQKCKEVYENYHITENMLCAGYSKGHTDTCAGDSGGPLLHLKNDKWTLYGITSFGDGCGKRGKYGIYAKTSKFVKWIRRTIHRHS